jgi:hypothetical protein
VLGYNRVYLAVSLLLFNEKIYKEEERYHGKSFLSCFTFHALGKIAPLISVTLGFQAKSNAHSMCA